MLITVIGCGSATGQIVPPFVIFAAKQLNLLWTRGEVSGSRYAVSDRLDRSRAFFLLAERALSSECCFTAPTSSIVRWS